MAYLNRIATVTPPNDVHGVFVGFASTLLTQRRDQLLFKRMSARGQIEHRWSCLSPAADPYGPAVDAEGFYTRGRFPSTGERMRRYQAVAPSLAQAAVEKLAAEGGGLGAVTHLVVTSCTGFSAPGLDLELVSRCGLDPTVERTLVGFMGCYAAISALKLARHIVRSDSSARVLVVSLELCTLHLQEVDDLEQVLTFLVFGDGCAAALVTGDPVGFSLDSFRAVVAPETGGHITWNIGDRGFDMFLSGQVPGAIGTALKTEREAVLGGVNPAEVALWAVHPGGRSVLDAVEQALELGPDALAASREVLRRYGNMSSPTVLFVLDALLRSSPAPGARGCAMAFGPGLTAETMLFSTPP
jgi:predicted naringenin-chalcone synthase